MTAIPLTLPEVQKALAAGGAGIASVYTTIYDRIEEKPGDPTWISLVPRADALKAASASVGRGLPLGGVPFAIKDNIDYAGLSTTAGCPDFAYAPAVSAVVVQRLIEAGAVAIGKTNLDQFATGLVGVRSPYGTPLNPFNPEYIPGGSSSGSAVAVAKGFCSFALGTDTAGSGRVPAALNELVGLKPTKGLLSTRGVVAACRSLDCISIFTKSCADAATVFRVAAAFDAEDPFSRKYSAPKTKAAWPLRIGVPRPDQLEFFGDAEAAELFRAAIEKWKKLGANLIEIDFEPFQATAKLLYEGAWVAERTTAIRDFLERKPGSLHPVTRQIIEGGRRISAMDAFESGYRLAALRRKTEAVWDRIDLLLTPTVGTAYRVTDVVEHPIQLNSNLGYYTNYVNLLDLCALALPAGRLSCGVPWGITLVAPAFQDEHLLQWGARFMNESPIPENSVEEGLTRVAVCGAHLAGLPLNGQLIERGARLVRATQTSADYRLYALPGTVPPKPGMIRVNTDGAAIEVEVWELPVREFGSFVARIPAPLGLGRIRLIDGESVQGFLCENAALPGAIDITSLGGWRPYLASRG